MKKALVLLMSIFLVFIVSQEVYAYALLGGKHKTNAISYRIGTFNGTYEKVGKHLNSAILDWNATSTKISFKAVAGTNQVVIHAKNFGNLDWSAKCTNYRDYAIAGRYTSSIIDGNLYFLNKSSYTGNMVKGVWSHEFGHALGLDHVNGTTKLMHPRDTRTVYKPTTDEINGVNSLYK